ncbi:MAG: hypothetical protein RR405_04515 [Clostridia bacterium]
MKRAAYAARDNSRTPVQWNATENAGFSTAKPWFTVNPNYKEVNVEIEENDPNSLLNFYRQLLVLRKTFKEAAIYGQFKLHKKCDRNLVVYDKIGDDGSKITVVINMSEKGVPSKRVMKYVDKDAKEIASVYNGSFAEIMRPYAGKVFVSKAK